MNRKFLGFLMALSIVILQGCGSTQKMTALKPHVAIKQFAADGKIALRFPRCDEYRGCKEEAFSASLRWLHKETLDELSLYDPTGQEALKIHYQGNRVVLEDKNGKQALTQAELAQKLGVPIPVEKLHDWIVNQRDNTNFSEDGWNVKLEQWQGQYYQRLTLRQEQYYLRILVNQLAAF